MGNIKRILEIKLPAGQSAFLWGARKTGKTTLLRQIFPKSHFFDFLNTDLYLDMSKNPALLRQQILALPRDVLKHPIILDEVQKVPMVLDEVHWLIENKGLSFVMCGSSARKLKRGHANLLGGRAWRYELYPLTTKELPNINLLKAMSHGLIPAHYLQVDATKSLKAYIQDYLKEEVFNEGLTRNIPAFSRFFDAMAYSMGEIVNYSNIARDCGVDSKTVREYYQILVDTLLGRFIEPFKKRQDRSVIIKAPKFYLFDVGVAAAVANRRIIEERGEAFGKAFEEFILMEIVAYRGYREFGFSINYWRTKTGLEVDFILGAGEAAIEVKGSSRVDSNDMRGSYAFLKDYKPKKAIIVSNEKQSRIVNGILVMSWRDFFSELWQGKIIR
jgi:predicted AAA+ superfamily ATPase